MPSVDTTKKEAPKGVLDYRILMLFGFALLDSFLNYGLLDSLVRSPNRGFGLYVNVVLDYQPK